MKASWESVAKVGSKMASHALVMTKSQSMFSFSTSSLIAKSCEASYAATSTAAFTPYFLMYFGTLK